MKKGKAGKAAKRKRGAGLSDGDTNLDVGAAEITLGWEKAGIGAAVTFGPETMRVSLGIGVAAVEIDLGEPHNSTVSYAFDLYEIEGRRNGCTVVLEYRIAGQLAKTETRKIPDCEEEKEQEKDDNLPPDNNLDTDRTRENDKIPGSLWDIGEFLLAIEGSVNTVEVNVAVLATVFLEEKLRLWNGGYVVGDNGIRSAEATLETKTFRDRLYIPHSYAKELVRREGHPTMTERQYQLSSLRFRTIGRREIERESAIQIANSTRRLYSQTGYGILRVFGPVGFVQHWVNLHIQPFAGLSENARIDSTNGYTDNITCTEFIKLLDHFIVEKKLPQRRGSNGRQNDKTRKRREKPMDEKCCKMIEQIYDILAVDEMIDEGFNVPKKWYAPEAKGYVKLDNYLQVQEYQMRMLDHYGIAPFVAKIADSDLAKKGNQELATQTINGTDAIRQILQNTMKLEAGNEGNLTATGAIMIALEQILQVATIGTRVVQEIFQYLGIPVKSQIFKLKLPFNTNALLKKIPQRNKKGGGQQKPRHELNTTENSTTLLPKMLTQKEKEYELEVYNDDYPTLADQLTTLTNNNGNNNSN